jgi:transposase-like protein
MKSKGPDIRPSSQSSQIIREVPIACADETAAVEFIERRRWGDCPHCPRCGATNVYKMMDAKTGGRNKRYLWRCRSCKQQYTVRIGTVFEESLLPLRHWCYALWRMSVSKKGVSALEIKRNCQITYKAALFMLNRLRFGMAPDKATQPKLIGTVEVDEVYIGGKPRKHTGTYKRGRGTPKTPVFVAVERGGKIHRRVVPNVTGATLNGAIRDVVDRSASLMSDENPAYSGICGYVGGRHQTVNHGAGEYSRDGVNVNTAESSNALVKRGIVGIYHNVSKEYLHRYLWQYDFLWDHREMTDGERLEQLVRATDGKRLLYKAPGDT